jgi:hypothetical protein
VHPFDQQLVELERRQHGLVALHQIEPEWKAGLVQQRLRARRSRVAPRVFAHPSVAPSYEQRLLTAVLSAGPDAVGSHESSARMWGLPLPGPARLEVMTSHTRRPLVAGVRMHRASALDPHDVVVVRGIPVTSCALTIYSLSSRFSLAQLGRMSDDAVRRGVVLLDDLIEVVERIRPANGRSRKKMRIVLDRRLPGVEDRESSLEDFLNASIVRFDLPRPVAQHPVVHGGRARRVDLCYPDEWLALEAKGFMWYRQRSVFDRDVLRGNDLQLAGFRVLSFTSAFTDLQIAQQIAEALGLPPPAAKPPLTFAAWRRRHG